MNKIKILFIVFISCVTLSCKTSLPGDTTIFIVRHSEKDTSDPKDQDPELSPEGRERAIALAGKLKKVKLDAAFATKYKRTHQTAYYSAINNSIQIQTYEGHDFAGIADLVKTKFSKKKVLIVGHSNTVLELLEAFGANRPIDVLADEDYDFLFKLNISPEGERELKILHYGKMHHLSNIK